MENDLLTNKKNAALLRESEREIVRHKIKPVDLREIQVAEWDKYLNRDVTLPPDVEAYLKADYTQTHALTEKEIHAIEVAVENYHGVPPLSDYAITMSMVMQETGKPWKYERGAGKYLTGLTLIKAGPSRTGGPP